MKTFELKEDFFGLFNKALLEQLFPLPYEGKMLLGELQTKNYVDYRNYYLNEGYFTILKNKLINLKRNGDFERSNAAREWNRLADVIIEATEIQQINEDCIDFPFSKSRNIESSEKKINISKHHRNSGMLIANDELWNKMLSLNNGKLYEEENIIKIKTSEIDIEFNTRNELIIAKMYNKFLSADLQGYDVYETQSPDGVLLLYREKHSDYKHNFILTTLGGIMTGSGVWFNI